MEDRELLEMAAKAAAIRHVDYAGVDYDGSLGLVLIDGNGRHLHSWNPLKDDGDALRLAITLKLDIAIDDYVQVSWWAEQGCLNWVNENCCRRAIVRAAAEIGKKIP